MLNILQVVNYGQVFSTIRWSNDYETLLGEIFNLEISITGATPIQA